MTSLSPDTVVTGMVLQLFGTGLSAATAATINGVNCTSFTNDGGALGCGVPMLAPGQYGVSVSSTQGSGGVPGGVRVLGSPVAWFDAADLTSLGIDAGNVFSWTDKSLHPANTLTQPMQVQQPLFMPNALNGKHTLRFSGGQSLTATPPALVSGNVARTLFVVASFASSGTRELFKFGGATGAFSIYQKADSRIQFDNAGASGVATPDGSVPLSLPLMISFLYGGTTFNQSVLSISGQNVPLTSYGNTAGPLITSGSGLSVGGTATFYFDGTIAELLVYDRDLTAAEQLLVENYLQAKWIP